MHTMIHVESVVQMIHPRLWGAVVFYDGQQVVGCISKQVCWWADNRKNDTGAEVQKQDAVEEKLYTCDDCFFCWDSWLPERESQRYPVELEDVWHSQVRKKVQSFTVTVKALLIKGGYHRPANHFPRETADEIQ